MQTTNDVIVVTGAAGFIGSCLVGYLNEQGYNNIVVVDDFSRSDKAINLEDKKFTDKVERDQFFQWLQQQKKPVDFIFHIGARTDTTEFDYEVHRRLNVEYSQKVWEYCTANKVPLVYASSAATYGAGELGYNDDHDVVERGFKQCDEQTSFANIMRGFNQPLFYYRSEYLLHFMLCIDIKFRCGTEFHAFHFLQVFR